jgi:hypothetical protein
MTWGCWRWRIWRVAGEGPTSVDRYCTLLGNVAVWFWYPIDDILFTNPHYHHPSTDLWVIQMRWIFLSYRVTPRTVTEPLTQCPIFNIRHKSFINFSDGGSWCWIYGTHEDDLCKSVRVRVY